MIKYFNKDLVLNYLLSFIILSILLTFIHKFFIYAYEIDLTKNSHIKTVINFIFTGKIFKTQKNIAFFLSLIGIILLSFSSIVLSMNIKFKKEITDGKVENVNIEKEEILENNAIENENTDNQIKDKEQAKNKSKFAIYNKDITKLNNNLFDETTNDFEENNETIETPINEDAEKNRLHNKIQELIDKMNKNKTVSNEKDLDDDSLEEKEISNNETILSRMKFKSSNKAENKNNIEKEINTEDTKIDMNYNTISEEQNTIMEQCLVNTGAKLLSEIRIGNSGGIDYLLVSKDKIDVIQIDTSNGNWVAGEDILENDKPLWLSDTGNKISPIYRATNAVNLIKNLLNDKNINNFEINPIVCIVNSNIINIDEQKKKWQEQNIIVTKLNSNINENDLPIIDEIFKANSLEEPNKKVLDNIIKILEEAEVST